MSKDSVRCGRCQQLRPRHSYESEGGWEFVSDKRTPICLECFGAVYSRQLRVSALQRKIEKTGRDGLLNKFLDLCPRLLEDETALAATEAKIEAILAPKPSVTP